MSFQFFGLQIGPNMTKCLIFALVLTVIFSALFLRALREGRGR